MRNKFYVIVDDQQYEYNNDEVAEIMARKYSLKEDTKYVEYGVLDFDGWKGKHTLAVLKRLEV